MKNQNQISGKIFKILPVEKGESKNGKEWKKQSIVIDTGDQYNPYVCVTLFGEKTGLLKNYKEGSNIVCYINISSREYNGKWYHNIDCWSIATNEAQVKSVVNSVSNDEVDELPF